MSTSAQLEGPILEDSVQDLNAEVGQRLKNIRLNRKMSQKEMAEALGITNKLLSAYEIGRLRVPIEVIVRYARALEVTTDDILNVDVGENPSAALLQKFRKIQGMPISQQKVILETMDTFIRGLVK